MLGPCRYDSPVQVPTLDYGPRDRVLIDDTVAELQGRDAEAGHLPAFEPAGPRSRVFFEPARTRAGIVTCGGLCPGLNDVIRGLTMVLHHGYGVERVEGFRFGYEGLNPAYGHEPMPLTPEAVRGLHQDGGTAIGSSRGPQSTAAMCDFLESRGVSLLFTVGGDGTLRGAQAISAEAERRGMSLAVVGVPKTIDNDIAFVDESFGFQTAFSLAVQAIRSAHSEAIGVRNGVGLVKLMGRHSGSIAAQAALANNDANFVLIPEVDFPLEGDGGLLDRLHERLQRRAHAVIVVAEGAGQRYCQSEGVDKSGNRLLGDIGPLLKQHIVTDPKLAELAPGVKYIDPSYVIRSLPANAYDSALCFQLAANAVHAAMSGRTGLIVGRFRGRSVHIPIDLAVSRRKQVDPGGELWRSVLESTGQPNWPAATLHFAKP